jgi:hypothetical protein
VAGVGAPQASAHADNLADARAVEQAAVELVERRPVRLDQERLDIVVRADAGAEQSLGVVEFAGDRAIGNGRRRTRTLLADPGGTASRRSGFSPPRSYMVSRAARDRGAR